MTLTSLLGDCIVSKSGEVKVSTLEGKKVIGIYFSAHWCPPCRAFTPALCEWYEMIKDEEGDSMEMVFVSSDRDEGAFNEYYNSMLWCAVPFSDRAKKLLAEPLVQTGILVVLLSMPISVTPAFLVSLYDWTMWMTEPLWLAMEVLGVAKLTITSSKALTDRMDDKPFLAKGFIAFISGVCYCIMFSLFWSVALSKTDDVKVFLAPIVVVAALVHIAVWFSDAGVISDAAVMSAFSMSLLYSMIYEIQDYKWAHSYQDWRSIDESMSFSRLLITTFTSSLNSMNQAWTFMVKLFHPWFIATALVRCYAVMFAVSWLKSWLKKDEEDDSFLFNSESEDEDDEDEDFGTSNPIASIVTWRSPLLARLVIIFVYTQLIINHLEAPGLLRSRNFGQHGEVSIARMLQIAFANCYYLHYLYKEHNPDLYEL